MKCQLKPTQHSENAVRVEFDRVIPPLFPRQQGLPGRLAPGDNEKILFGSSPAFRAKHSLRVARGNAGKFPFELVNPSQSYAVLFDRLASIEGLVDVVDLDRYSLGMEVGGLFSVPEVARELVTAIQQTFYPEEEIVWGRGFEVPVIETLGVETTTGTETPVVDESQEAATPKTRTVLGE